MDGEGPLGRCGREEQGRAQPGEGRAEVGVPGKVGRVGPGRRGSLVRASGSGFGTKSWFAAGRVSVYSVALLLGPKLTAKATVKW